MAGIDHNPEPDCQSGPVLAALAPRPPLSLRGELGPKLTASSTAPHCPCTKRGSWGVLLTPAMGAVFMSASTVIVAINARLLRLKK